jgi:hypothetical protein
MAAGEYVSVSSQSDTERADLAREARELKEDPEFEKKEELARICRSRGASLSFPVCLAYPCGGRRFAGLLGLARRDGRKGRRRSNHPSDHKGGILGWSRDGFNGGDWCHGRKSSLITLCN